MNTPLCQPQDKIDKVKNIHITLDVFFEGPVRDTSQLGLVQEIDLMLKSDEVFSVLDTFIWSYEAHVAAVKLYTVIMLCNMAR
ncbi:hypothetical protein HYFRA_00005991 [Hymenoscyphus fraxineus]|uniref:Uncharacterized protein n=1 Tax=Hymenoscyphus fraxineus TaxID=746836 RepID=A0A9N9PP89_9HELO|nr:hypothetical protein HYFRA_00005991 [Hymenoscyphus fraxineus]